MQHWNYRPYKTMIIPENGGIPKWVLHQEIGSQVRTELPSNWYEDNHFLEFAFFYLYLNDNDFEAACDIDSGLHEVDFDLRLGHDLELTTWCKCPKIDGDATDRLWLTLYPKSDIPKKYHRNQPWNFLAVFSTDRCRKFKRYTLKILYTTMCLSSWVIREGMTMTMVMMMMMPSKTKHMICNHALKD